MSEVINFCFGNEEPQKLIDILARRTEGEDGRVDDLVLPLRVHRATLGKGRSPGLQYIAAGLLPALYRALPFQVGQIVREFFDKPACSLLA